MCLNEEATIMDANRWRCRACCEHDGVPYLLPLDACLCATCGAPVTIDDVQCCALAGHEFASLPAPGEDADGAPMPTVREELQRLTDAVLELKAKLLGPAPVAVPVEDAAAILGCGRTQVFKYLAQGKLTRAKKIGRRVTVTLASIEALQAPKKERRPRLGCRPRNVGVSIRALPLGEEQDRKGAPRTASIRPPLTRNRGVEPAGPRDVPA